MILFAHLYVYKDWAYVFPLAAMATASVQYAATEDSVASHVMAWFFIVLASLALIFVFLRMSWHHVGVLRGKEVWGDPVFEQWEKGLLEVVDRQNSDNSQENQTHIK
jgi:hypothetical protein